MKKSIAVTLLLLLITILEVPPSHAQGGGEVGAWKGPQKGSAEEPHTFTDSGGSESWPSNNPGLSDSGGSESWPSNNPGLSDRESSGTPISSPFLGPEKAAQARPSEIFVGAQFSYSATSAGLISSKNLDTPFRYDGWQGPSNWATNSQPVRGHYFSSKFREMQEKAEYTKLKTIFPQ